jgi:thiamine-monophosphate kinase
MKLRQLGEDRLLGQLLPSLPTGKGVLVPAGDDCAVVGAPAGGDLLLLKTDCVVEKIHFGRETDPGLVGWKAMMRPLSDFAAMSGVPQFALITLIVPGKTTNQWVKKLYAGLTSAALKFGVAIVGGETSSTSGPITISVSVSGVVEKNRLVTRSGGKSGDDLFVTGRLGGSIRGKHLRFLPRINESRWLTRNFSIHAMIDLSDGLGADLPRLARRSNVWFDIDEKKLPRSAGVTMARAISDGEDFELLFAISPRQRERLERAWARKFRSLPLTRIGRLNRKSTIKNRKLGSGYVHFK